MVKNALMAYKTAKVPKILPTIRDDRFSKNGPALPKSSNQSCKVMAVATEQTKPILSKVVGVRLDRLVRNFMARMAKLDPAHGARPVRMQAPVLIMLKSEEKSCVDIRPPNTMPNAPQPPNKITISNDTPQGKNNHVKPLASGKKPNTHALSVETNKNAKAVKATLALVIKEGIRAFSEGGKPS